MFATELFTLETGFYTQGEVQLLGLTVRGQLQRICLPARREDARLSGLPSTQVGRGVKDLLSAIGDVCERYTRHNYILMLIKYRMLK